MRTALRWGDKKLCWNTMYPACGDSATTSRFCNPKPLPSSRLRHSERSSDIQRITAIPWK